MTSLSPTVPPGEVRPGFEDSLLRGLASETPRGQRIVSRVLLILIRGYQLLVSPWLGSACRFAPSCSCYAHDAIVRYGAWRGLGLAARRLARCHPFHPGGWDPVR